MDGFLGDHGDLKITVRNQVEHHTGEGPPDIGVRKASFREFLVEETGKDLIVLAFSDLPIYRALRPYYDPLSTPLRAVHRFPLLTMGRNSTGSGGHRHEENWVAQIAGTKIWILAPPGVQTPPQDLMPCPMLDEREQWTPGMVSCAVKPGELIYLPDGWYHATCNIGSYTLGVGGKGGTDHWSEAMYHIQTGNETALRSSPKLLAAAVRENDPPALTLAASHGPMSLVDLLLEARADPKGRDKDGWLAIHTAAEAGQADLVEHLMLKGVPAQGVQAQGADPLHMAAAMGHLAVVRVLLDGRVDPAAKDGGGSQALHWAASGSSAELVQELLARRSDPTVREKDGGDAVSWALRSGHHTAVDLLLEAGGKLDRHSGHSDVARYLKRKSGKKAKKGTGHKKKAKKGEL